MIKINRIVYICLFALVIGNLCLAEQTQAKNFYETPDFCNESENYSSIVVVKMPTDGGIREEISERFRERFEKWKNEFLASDFGRDQWDYYATNKNFVLKIKINNEEGQGAGTSDYLWDESGNLVGATITLGSKLDKGFPDPIYFPVMNSLSIESKVAKISENVLAAAKIAHEFGHVNQTAKTDRKVFLRQNKLMTEYNEILQANNFDMNLPKLADLKGKLGGTPVEIWENREYWGETNAMFYLLNRFEKERFYCSVVSKIEKNIKKFAVNYEDRFSPVFESSGVCRD